MFGKSPVKIDKKFWINLVCFILGGILLIYLYSKYRIAPDIHFSELEIKNTSGQPVHISGYKGKVVVINFWQTWCGPCCHEMSSIEFAKENTDSTKISFIAITDEAAGKIESFKEEKNYTFDFFQSVKTLKQLGINTYPTTYILGANGKVVMTKIGEVDWSLPQNLNQLKGIAQ